jgi:4'-phosphopantetheinyl transferase
MPEGLEFIEAAPESVAARLDAGSVHLWRMAYEPSQGRAPLRELLGTYLGKAAAGVALAEGKHGKPELADAVSGRRTGSVPALEFNWSHSGSYALVALSGGPALGVDVERLGRKLPAIELARRYFDPAEAKVLASLPLAVRERAFMGLWCAKEAVLKSAGEGLSFGLARLAFEWRGDMEWKLVRVDPALGNTDEWQLLGFDAALGYRGALAWRGRGQRIVAFRSPSAI